jgi:hypothetical protein
MKRMLCVILVSCSFSVFAVAQITQPATDVLGAHLVYGRGCTACHTPHSGAAGNGSAGSANSGSTMLWGEDASALYGKTIQTDGGKYVEVLPSSMSAATPDVSGMLTCLSCHDGNFAPNAMMKNRLYESLPSTYGNHNSIPTLLASTGPGSYISDHPMGLNATISCNGAKSWDCTQSNGVITMRGAKSGRFVSNYGFFVQPGVYNNTSVVVCTTCHDPHAMSVVTVNRNSNSGLPPGTYATMFFLRAPYNPNDTNPMSNQTAQFCRQCHADKSNEMNGGTAGTVF